MPPFLKPFFSEFTEEIHPPNQAHHGKAKEYARIRRRFLLLDLLLALTLLLLWLGAGWSEMLRDWISGWTQNQWIAVAAFGLIFGGVFFLLDIPLSYYTGFILPHRFDQSNQSLKSWVSDLIKRSVLSLILGGFLLEINYLVLQSSPQYWWLWTGGILLLINVLLVNLVPVLLLPLFNTFIPLEDEYQNLAGKLLQLAKKSGVSVKGVFSYDMSRRTKTANAGLTGLGGTRRIILGDTMLKEFTEDEIETVLAHELGHQAHHDIPLRIAFNSLLTLGGLYLASLGLSWGVAYFDFHGPADIAALPLIGLILGALGIILMPVNKIFSRWRERRADAFAINLTNNGAAFISALTRLANQNLAEIDPEPWVEFLLYSHPSLSRRISMIQAMDPDITNLNDNETAV